MKNTLILVILIFTGCVFGQEPFATEIINSDTSAANTTLKSVLIVIICEKEMVTDLQEWITNFFNSLSMNHSDVKLNQIIFPLNRMNLVNSENEFCKILQNGLSIIIDVTITGWKVFQYLASSRNIPYLKIRLTNYEFIQSTLEYIKMKHGKDTVMIFQSEKEADYGLYNVIASSTLRIIVLDQFHDQSLKRMKTLRPMPSFYIMIASAENMTRLFDMALSAGLLEQKHRWLLYFTDFHPQNFKYNLFTEFPEISKFIIDPNLCCRWLSQSIDCECPENFQILYPYFQEVLKIIFQHIASFNYTIYTTNCLINEPSANITFQPQLFEDFNNHPLLHFVESDNIVEQLVNVSIYVNQNDSLTKIVRVAEYTNQNIHNVDNFTKLRTLPGREILTAKRYLRIGTIEAVPWAYIKRDPNTNEVILDENKKPVWEGYCIDFAQRLSVEMHFDYEFVSPETGRFGKKLSSGKWDGLIGDLIRGETDISVAPLKMTAEREEVIDFIAPYFEQTGILIVMRNPVRQTSLFKFMTVLRLEVWLSIVGALVATAIMIWLLDKYSPYSARNNPEAYPYPCREFTLKESFWFALTSFTPQGGGEAPKAISGRTLVAAYWLFVVLMLATFTANLAAFLTVERMQTPVQSLDQLARQSRINYTVVANSDTYQYFSNMKSAEDTLYRVWKEITLNSTSDRAEYRVWDYPIKEQYSHILMAIDSAGPVENASQGFQKVNELINADFAFIHDSAEIKYAISTNCNFTEVGEVFAEQPYALAVQQGSHLQDELSRTILVLQKQRYFEGLSSKYWNNSVKGECPNSDDSEGITLESLGGVFIATLFGLTMAMITLVGEVIYYRKKEKQGKIMKVQPIDYTKNNVPTTLSYTKNMKLPEKSKIPKQITFGNEFLPAAGKQHKVSFISIFSKNNSGNRIDNMPIE